MNASSTYGQRAPVGRRAAGLALAALANLLLILMLLSLAPFAPSGPPAGRAPVLIDLPPAQETARTRTAARRKAEVTPSQPQRRPDPPPPPTPPVPLDIMIVSKQVFAASDISKLPQRRTELAANAAGASASAGAQGDDDGPTETGPNGERLYNARWYVEPTQAELAYYVPANAPRPAVAMIACKTVARFRVEDCVPLGETPAGSGLARAIVNAAWQFKIRPPSIGGKAMVGEWVRIRIDFTLDPAKKGG